MSLRWLATLPLLVVLSSCGVSVLPAPTIEQLLDGREKNEERLAAVEQVVAVGSLLPFEESAHHGPEVVTTCDEGQNNYKVHDGYRLSCGASATFYVSFSGDFSKGREKFLEGLSASGCRVDGAGTYYPDRMKPTTKYWPTEFDGYDCGGGAYLDVSWGMGTDLVHSPESLQLGPQDYSDMVGGGGGRWLSGPTQDALISGLSTHDWFAVVRTSRTFYRDRV